MAPHESRSASHEIYMECVNGMGKKEERGKGWAIFQCKHVATTLSPPPSLEKGEESEMSSVWEDGGFRINCIEGGGGARKSYEIWIQRR